MRALLASRYRAPLTKELPLCISAVEIGVECGPDVSKSDGLRRATRPAHDEQKLFLSVCFARRTSFAHPDPDDFVLPFDALRIAHHARHVFARRITETAGVSEKRTGPPVGMLETTSTAGAAVVPPTPKA